METQTIAITGKLIDKWQSAVNLLADIIEIPIVLIARVEPACVRLIASSDSGGNPYKAGEIAGSELAACCFSALAAADSAKTDSQNNGQTDANQAAECGAALGYGLPLRWPNGVIFGVFLVLDNRLGAGGLSKVNQRTVAYFRDASQADLPTLFPFEGCREQMRTALVDLPAGYRTKDLDPTSVGRHIGDIPEIETRLRDSQERLRLILDNTAALVYMVDTDDKILFVNQRWLNIFHFSLEQVLGKSIYDVFPSEIADAYHVSNLKAFRSGPVEEEEIAPQDDGLHTYISLKFPLFDSAGGPNAVCGISTDITQRKRAENELRQSKEWFERMFQDSPFPFWELDLSAAKKYLDGLRAQGTDPADLLRTDPGAALQCARMISQVRFNNAMLRLNEASSEQQLVGWLSVSFADESQGHIQNFRELMIGLAGGNHAFELESVTTTMGGRQVVYLSRVIVPPGCEETWSRVLISSLDLTERKRAEQAMAYFAAIVESSHDAIIGTDLEGKILSWNNGAQGLYGYSAEEVIGRSIKIIVPPQRDDMDIITERLRRGEGVNQLETLRLTKDGQLKDVSLTVSPLRDSSGAVIGSCGIGRNITVHKRADAELREAKDRYEALFNEAPISLYELDLSGVKKIIDELRAAGVTDLATHFKEHPEEVARCGREFKWIRINKTTLRLRGASSEAEFLDWIGQTLAEDSSGPFRVFEDNILAFAAGATVYEREVVTPSVGGKWLNILGRVMIMPGYEDTWSRVLVSGVDLTELRRAEAARAYLSYIVESSDDAIFGNTLEGLVTSWNRGAEHLYGFSAEEVMGKHISFLMPPGSSEDPNRIKTLLDSAPRVERYETVHIAKDGRRVDVSMTVSPILNAEGLLIGSSVIARDITQRNRVEEALRKSQQDYSSLVNSIDGIVWRVDPGTFTFTFVSTYAERMLGYPRGKWLEAGFWNDHVHPDDWPWVIESSRKAVALKKDHELQYRMIHSDGHIVWLHDLVTVIVEDDRPVELRGVTVDVTEHRKAEEALRRSEEEHRLFFELNLAGNYISTPDGTLVNCNMAFARMFGFDSVEAAVTSGVGSLYANPKARRAFVDLVKTHKRLEYFEEELLRKDGSTVHVIENVIGSFNDDGELAEIRGYLVDDTERRKVEQQLRESQRLEAIGRLAGGIAHDFNNLMTIILGYSQLMLRRTAKSDPNYNEALEIRKAGERAAALTSQLLAFSRKQILQPRVINLNEVVTDLDKMLRRIIGEDIDLAIIAHPKAGRVKADPGQIEQVIVNLSVNARDAMPGGGRLTIETTNAYLDETYAASHIGVTPGQYVMLAVSDNGAGMSEEVQSHIFEPFYTTKLAGKGTGLGLSTVYGIVKQSGGNIWVYSEPGQGTTFKIYLPRVEEPAGPNTQTDVDDNEYRGTETVLLVEDESGVRELAARTLREAGFLVIQASSGDEALRLMGQPGSPPIDLLVTDVVMPGLGGKELADRLDEISPATRVLFVTGYTDNAVVHHGHLKPGIDILPKPFTPMDLTRKAREVLDSPVQSGAV